MSRRSSASSARRGETAFELAQLALRRIGSAPRLSAVLLLGALLAVGLASSAPIFIDAVRDLGLKQTLVDAEPSSLDLRFIRSNVSADADAVNDVEGVIRAESATATASFASGRLTAVRTGGFILRTDDQPFNEPDTDHATFLAQEEMASAVSVVEGELPATSNDVLEIAIEQTQAERFDLSIGDERLAQPFWLGTQHETRVRVVGIFEPSGDQRRWSTLDDSFLPSAARETELRFWTTRDNILGPLAAQSPSLRLTLLQRLRVDLTGASAAEATAAANALERMSHRIAQSIENVTQESELLDTLAGFRDRFQFAQSTLLMVVLQLVGAVLVYAVVAAAMLAEQRTEDTAWLKSRGARQRDVAMLHIVEAAILTAPAIALGPVIGMGLVSLLGLVPPFDEALLLTNAGRFLPVSLPIEAWYLALGAGALALLAQAAPTYRASRQTMVTSRRERGRPPASWTQRALIDAAVAALGALLIFELQWAGDPLDTPLVGEARLDWLAVATPTVLLFVVGLIVLRLFPPTMRTLARLVSPWRSLTLLLGAWYLGRTPTHYARTVLLLTIAGALAVFAASFRHTLDASYDARAEHAVGATVRVSEPLSQTLPFDAIASETGQPVARVQRISGAFDGDEGSGRLQIAALDAEVIASQLGRRNADWTIGAQELRSLMPGRQVQDRAVIEGFGGSVTLTLIPINLLQSLPVGIKVLDANGRYWWYQLGVLDPDIELNEEGVPKQIELRARIGAEPSVFLPLEGARIVRNRSAWRPGVEERPTAPLTLISVDLALARSAGEIWLNQLTFSQGGETRVLADFSADFEAWQAIPLAAGEEAVDQLDQTIAGAGFRWDATPTSLRGVSYRIDQSPLPVLLSTAALEQGRLEIGDDVRIRIGPTPMVFSITGAFDTFPTYDEQRDDPLVIVDRSALVERLYGSAAAGVALAVEDELWVSAPLKEWESLIAEHTARQSDSNARRSALGVGNRTIVVNINSADINARPSTLEDNTPQEQEAESTDISAALASVRTLDQARDELAADPLIVASWNGVFLGALAAVAIASAFGLVVLTAVTAQARRVEFAVCQSVGMSVRQILGLIAMEQVIVMVIGLGAGLIVGTQAGAVLLDFFALTPDGRDVVPPLQFAIDWPVVGVLFGALIALFALNLGAFLWFLRRIELHGALRLAA